jgi:hypothetical protein
MWDTLKAEMKGVQRAEQWAGSSAGPSVESKAVPSGRTKAVKKAGQ